MDWGSVADWFGAIGSKFKSVIVDEETNFVAEDFVLANKIIKQNKLQN